MALGVLEHVGVRARTRAELQHLVNDRIGNPDCPRSRPFAENGDPVSAYVSPAKTQRLTDPQATGIQHASQATVTPGLQLGEKQADFVLVEDFLVQAASRTGGRREGQSAEVAEAMTKTQKAPNGRGPAGPRGVGAGEALDEIRKILVGNLIERLPQALEKQA